MPKGGRVMLAKDQLCGPHLRNYKDMLLFGGRSPFPEACLVSIMARPYAELFASSLVDHGL